MTINLSDNDPRISYTVASGVTQGTFTVPFEFFTDADLNLYVDGTLKTLSTDYTTTGGNGGTGTIVMNSGSEVTGIAGSSTVVITRSIALERTTDFQTSGPFAISALNTELDKLVAIQADLKDSQDRSLQLTDYDADASLTLPDVNTRKGKLLAFNATTGAVEAGASIAGTNTVAALSADIETLADIEDGTVATDSISDLAAIASDVTTSASIAANITTVAGISSDVTAVAADTTDIGTVATNISSVNTVATNIADVITVANDLNEAISEIETAADDLNEAVSDIDTVSQNIANVNAVGAIDTDVTTVAGIASNVTTTAGISTDVTTVAGISSNVTTVAGVSANVTTVAGVSSDVTTVAGISSDVTTAATNNANITTVAGAISNVNAVGTDISNVNTVAANITDVNNFADTYFVSSTAPTSPTQGDLWFDTDPNALLMKVYDGSGWVNAGSSVNGTAERNTYTATSGQTSFAATYDAGYVDVYLNGVKLIDGTDFTATSGTSIVLASGAALNDTVDIVAYGTFELLNTSINDLSDVSASSATSGQFLKYNGTNWVGDSLPSSDLVNDTTPQLGGNLDLNSSDITGTGNVNITGSVTASGDLTVDTDTLYVDSTNNYVGIGTSSPTTKLQIAGGIGLTDGGVVSSTSSPAISTYYDTSNDYGVTATLHNGTAWKPYVIRSAGMIFQTSSDAEAMRVNSSGTLMVGGTVFAGSTSMAQIETNGTLSFGCSTTTSTTRVQFFNANGFIGNISTSGSSTSYATSSDYRLKENVTADWDATTRLKQLNPVRFNFISDADTTVDGFLAHEVQDVVPEAITGTKDAVDDEGNPVYQGIDQSKLVPLLVKTIQELEARITALENV